MKSPLLCLAILWAAPAALRAAAPPVLPQTTAEQSPLPLGPATPDGFDDPAHLHFFRYQAHLRRVGLAGLDAQAWSGLSADQRAARIKDGEAFLKDKFSALMSAPGLNPPDAALLNAVWGKDVAVAVGAVGAALTLGDPGQIRAERERVQRLVQSVGGAAVDWASIFDNAVTPSGAPVLPDPLAPQKRDGFLDSLAAPETLAPLASRPSFDQFLAQHNGQVTADAIPALDALYQVLSKAHGEELKQTAHLLPTLVRFLNDGKKIVNEETPGALAFAVPGDYDRPDRVGITAQSRATDPVEVASVLAHEFQHVYDMYAGRYYTLDSELRGFKANVMFLKIMRDDRDLSKKLDQLLDSDSDDARLFFQDQSRVAAAYDRSQQAFADEVAFGHGYNQYFQGVFNGRLSLREAVDPNLGLQRQISGQTTQLSEMQAESAALQARLNTLRARPSSPDNDRDIEKASRDLAAYGSAAVSLQKSIDIDTLRLRRMKRETVWLDKTADGQPLPPYDLNLPVGGDYTTGGS